MIIVFDTNVLISAFLFPGGWPDKIVKAFLVGRLNHATSPDILTEFKKVLSKKFGLSEPKLKELVYLVSSSSKLVYPEERLDVIQADPQDNRILECAVSGQASYIITGDKQHLLPLRQFQKIHIVSPHQFSIEQGIL